MISRKYGSVFKAKHNRTDTFVAVKCIYAFGHEMDELFKEIEIMKSLDCSNIVRYYGTFYKDNTLFVIKFKVIQIFVNFFFHSQRLLDNNGILLLWIGRGYYDSKRKTL